jgi:hypothetical protein
MSRAALANPSVVRLLVLLVVAVATGTSGVAIAQTYSTILDSSEDQTPQGVRGAGGSNALLAASYTPAGATAPQGMWWLGNLATNTGTAYKFNPVIGDQVVTSALYYGPDTAEFNPSLGAGNIRIVGSYQYTGSTQDNNGVLCTGPLTGGGTWTQINVPNAVTSGTVANTIPHSVMGSIARLENGTFGPVNWTGPLFFPGASTTTGNTVSGDQLLGIYQLPNDPTVYAYVATVPEPAALLPVVAALGCGWCLVRRRFAGPVR